MQESKLHDLPTPIRSIKEQQDMKMLHRLLAVFIAKGKITHDMTAGQIIAFVEKEIVL